MTRRNSNSSCTSGDSMTYDGENRMTQMIVGATTTNFAYNGESTRVKRQVVGVGTTYYVGNHYEVYVPQAGTTTFNKYYYFGSQRVAARLGSTTPSNGTLFYMQGDHPSILRDKPRFIQFADDEWRCAEHAANVFSLWRETCV